MQILPWPPNGQWPAEVGTESFQFDEEEKGEEMGGDSVQAYVSRLNWACNFCVAYFSAHGRK